jgi:hypothetical protein
MLWAALGCGREDIQVGAEVASAPMYIEAENGRLSGAFTVESDPLASGGKYILSPPVASSIDASGGATAEYWFRTRQAGAYFIWGRIQAPGAANNSFWVTVDASPPILWKLSTGVIWFWGRLTSGTDYGHPIEYALGAGLHRIVFGGADPGVGLDRLYVTVPGDVPPGNDTPCDPPNSIQLADGGCQASCGTLKGTTCGSNFCAGLTPLPAYDCAVCCRVPDDGGASDAQSE